MMVKQVRKRHWLALSGPARNNNYFNLNSQNNFKHAESNKNIEVELPLWSGCCLVHESAEFDVFVPEDELTAIGTISGPVS